MKRIYLCTLYYLYYIPILKYIFMYFNIGNTGKSQNKVHKYILYFEKYTSYLIGYWPVMLIPT